MIPAKYMAFLKPLAGIATMLEFGNKRGTDGPGDTYKAAFEAMGIRHTSVDLNGEDGALAMDLSKPLDLGRFDMVTNIGTSEHVRDQAPVWRNAITAAQKVFVSITPHPGDWPGHGFWYPSADFYAQLAQRNAFDVIKLDTLDGMGRRLIACRMERRAEALFQLPDGHTMFAAPPRRPSKQG